MMIRSWATPCDGQRGHLLEARGTVMRAEIHIREAQEADSGFISALLAEMGHPLGTETVGANLRAMKALAPRYGTFVAVINQSVVGVVSAFASSVLHRPHGVGRISVLTVARAF